MIPVGTADNFLEVQLKPEAFEAAAKEAGFPVTMRMQVCKITIAVTRQRFSHKNTRLRTTYDL